MRARSPTLWTQVVEFLTNAGANVDNPIDLKAGIAAMTEERDLVSAPATCVRVCGRAQLKERNPNRTDRSIAGQVPRRVRLDRQIGGDDGHCGTRAL